MKNWLWFLYKPQDEREKELYYQAYARAFNFAMIVLFISFLASRIIPHTLRNSYQEFSQLLLPLFLPLYFLVIIVVAYFIGWTSLRREDIGKVSDFGKNLPSTRLIWGVLGGLHIVFIAILLLSKEFYYSIFIGWGVVWIIAVRIIAWRSTNKLQLPMRLIIVGCIPLLTIIFSRLRSQGFLKRTGKAILVGISLVLGVNMVIILILMFPLLPQVYRDFKVNSLSCSALPTAQKAQEISLNHKEALEEAVKKAGAVYSEEKVEVRWVIKENYGYIEGFKEGSEGSFISIGWGEREECEGKGRDGADILIVHNTQKEREVIEKLFGETFFGIPYRFWDV